MKKVVSLSIIAALGLTSAVQAAQPSYSYIQGAYQSETLDLGGGDEFDLNGFGFGGSVEFGEYLFARASLSSVSGDEEFFGTTFDADLDNRAIGVGVRFATGESTSLFLAFDRSKASLKVDADSWNVIDDSVNGNIYTIGLRQAVGEMSEFHVSFGRVEVEDVGDNMWSIGTIIGITQSFGLTLDYNSSDDVDGFAIGGRISF